MAGSAEPIRLAPHGARPPLEAAPSGVLDRRRGAGTAPGDAKSGSPSGTALRTSASLLADAPRQRIPLVAQPLRERPRRPPQHPFHVVVDRRRKVAEVLGHVQERVEHRLGEPRRPGGEGLGARQLLDLSPRHLSLLALLLFDGPATVNDLASRLEVAPTTVSLMVGELSRKGVLERREDGADRRRRIVSITAEMRPEIEAWLAGSAAAWRKALEPLTEVERVMFVQTLETYERALDGD